jgi:hypothetical protein
MALVSTYAARAGVNRLVVFRRSIAMELVPGNSLITPDAESGRALAVKMSRLSIKLVQPDDAVRGELRGVYANDAAC